MKCRVSAFNVQGSKVIIVVVQIRTVKTYVGAMEALRKKERQDETQCTTKIGGKTSLGPSLSPFVKFSFPVTCLMPYYAKTGCFRPLIA
jgi:hypothetical protein